MGDGVGTGRGCVCEVDEDVRVCLSGLEISFGVLLSIISESLMVLDGLNMMKVKGDKHTNET